MADNLCGPSNALQNFQKHSTADRTLQQDRLTSRNASSQGFRSAPGPSAGMLDPEFEAFQAGQMPLPPLDGPGFQHTPFPNTPQHMQQPGFPGWANDFQRMNISSPPPQLQHNYPQLAQQSHSGGWHQEFAQQQNQHVEYSSQNQHNYNTPFERLSSLAQMSTYHEPRDFTSTNFSPLYQAGPQHAVEQTQQSFEPAIAEAFDEEAFARAFDEAAKSEFSTEQANSQGQSLEIGQDILINETAEQLLSSETLEDTERIGADLIHDPRQEDQDEPQQQNDPDALARTAGQLLNSVKDNQSDKFQNSSFLALMRQLRDKEVTVEGDKIVDVQTESQEMLQATAP